LADQIIELPPKGCVYMAELWRCRKPVPDHCLLLTNSTRGDFEGLALGARKRTGIAWPGKWRPFLNYPWPLPIDCQGVDIHQFDIWKRFLYETGFIDASPSLKPMKRRNDDPVESGEIVVGFIPTSANEPAKRWPEGHWRRLIREVTRHPSVTVRLFGSPEERPAVAEVAEDFPPDRVFNQAGIACNLAELLPMLQECDVIAGNDTGGSHLANAVGVPLVVLFGPTNPNRTRAIFDAPVRILQPPGCPPNGGGRMDDIAPENVLEAIKSLSTETGKPLA